MEKKEIRAEISARLAFEFECFYEKLFSHDAVLEAALRTYMALPRELQGRLITAKFGDEVKVLRKGLLYPFDSLFVLSDREQDIVGMMVEQLVQMWYRERARSILIKIKKELPDMVDELATKANLSNSEKSLLKNYLQTLGRFFLIEQSDHTEGTS